MSRDRPSRADHELARAVREAADLPVSGRQIRRWANAGLVDFTLGRPGPGRDRRYPPEATATAAEVADLLVSRGRTLYESTVILFYRGRPIPEDRLREAYWQILMRFEEMAEKALDPLLDDTRPHGAPARWGRSFSQTERGKVWRSRLRDLPQERHGGEPLTQPSRPDRHRTLHPAKAIRGVLTAMVELLTGTEPSDDASEILHRAVGIDAISIDELVGLTPSLEDMRSVAEEAPIESIEFAIDWIRSLDELDKLAGLGLPDISSEVELIGSELERGLGALTVVALWPDYQPPDELRKLLALTRVAGAVGPELLVRLLGGFESQSDITDSERAELQESLRRFAIEHPEEVETLTSGTE